MSWPRCCRSVRRGVFKTRGNGSADYPQTAIDWLRPASRICRYSPGVGKAVRTHGDEARKGFRCGIAVASRIFGRRPFAMKITDFRDMSGKISFVQAGLMACCIAVAVQCHAPKVVLYDYGTGQKETIDRKIIEHEIRNPDLKRLLKEFDDTYDDSTEVRGEGLNLSCDIYSDSICYTIDYTTNISYAGPRSYANRSTGKKLR